MNEVATEEAQWTMNELQTQLERPNSRYQEMYKGFQMWTIEQRKYKYRPKHDKELASIFNGTWDLTEDEGVDELLTYKAQIKKKDVITKAVLSTFLSDILKQYN